MPNSLVSIIVPIYNVERHIESCLGSIAKQTYSNFEVILVNDGSTDKSEEICNYWIHNQRDKRFRLLKKTNGGLSEARNFGLKHCAIESEYVVFVDSDDELLPDCLISLLKHASHELLIIGTLLRCRKDHIPPINNTEDKGIVFHDIWHNHDFLSQLRDGIINSCCGNCYSLRVIRQNNLFFKRLLPEDTFFNIEYLSFVSNVVVDTRPIYLYYIWNDSMSTKPKEEIFINYMHIQQLLYDKVDLRDRKKIDRFVYPQYRVNSMNFIHKGEYTLPQKYLGMDLIRKSWDSYKPVSFPDRVLHFCLRHRLFKIAKFF